MGSQTSATVVDTGYWCATCCVGRIVFMAGGLGYFCICDLNATSVDAIQVHTRQNTINQRFVHSSEQRPEPEELWRWMVKKARREGART